MPSLLGIFGGTFDPPHLGHLILAAEAHQQLSLTRLLWVLTPDPPHKQAAPILPLAHRLTMLQLAISGDADFELSRVEMDRPGPHYALDTLNLLAEQNPGAEMVYLMGGDSLRDLPTWHRPADLLSACRYLGVMRRPGDNIDLPALEAILPGITSKVRFLEAPLLDISSRQIRQRIAEGHPFRYYLPPAVYRYIVRHQLYR
ncbi:MAG: nicotinate-nucleotide adenylyltransferase [Anaerolineales bacterium]|nr:nicotinate-nucleotide adenylyltransferase [Anaerolineales bacterium]MDO9349454.1 nicotinate-nucleotide adenylyltransferase [Anaerolineales bacterium]